MVRIINPAAEAAVQDQKLAARRSTIDGATVALLDNNKPGAGAILEGVAEAMIKHGVVETLHRRKSHPAGPSPYIADLVHRVDAAVSAVGD